MDQGATEQEASSFAKLKTFCAFVTRIRQSVFRHAHMVTTARRAGMEDMGGGSSNALQEQGCAARTNL